MAYIQISLTENDKKMLESAGQLVGLKTSTFVRMAGCDRARKLIKENQVEDSA